MGDENPDKTGDQGEAAEVILLREHRGARILLVEDDMLNREVALFLLRECGMAVTTAVNGAEALEHLATEPFDLVLMDMQMPVMDGLEATRCLRRMSSMERIPVLAMTANAFADDRAACMAAGMNDFVSKPVDPDLLYQVLLRWLATGSNASS